MVWCLKVFEKEGRRMIVFLSQFCLMVSKYIMSRSCNLLQSVVVCLAVAYTQEK